MKRASTLRSLSRSVGMGVLLSMLFFYGIHVFGNWQIENYRPDPETTSSLLLHNKCAILNDIHTLRPNTPVAAIGEGIDGIKLGGSFMNFTDGHITAMLLVAVLLTGLIFLVRKKINA